MPDGIESIGPGAFFQCKNLRSVTLPDSVKSIGSTAFFGCDSLSSITIPDSVTSIGEDAFFGCDSMKSIPQSKNIKKETEKEVGTQKKEKSGEKTGSQSSNTKHECDAPGCNKTATHTITGISGKNEYYCDQHYKEMQDTLTDMAESVKHTCEAPGCSKEGTYSITGISGRTEYYCSNHYQEMRDMIDDMSRSASSSSGSTSSGGSSSGNYDKSDSYYSRNDSDGDGYLTDDEFQAALGDALIDMLNGTYNP